MLVTPPVVAFGSRPENTTSLGQTVTIANSGSGTRTISSIGAVGPDTAPFREAIQYLAFRTAHRTESSSQDNRAQSCMPSSQRLSAHSRT